MTAWLLGMLLVVNTALASTPPETVVRETSDQVLAEVMQRKQELQAQPGKIYQLVEHIVLPRFDFQRMSRLVLGKYWRRASEQQRAEFSHQFQRLLVRTYSTAFKEFQGWEISYTPLRMNAGDQDVAVHTQVTREGAPPVDVVYRMHVKDGDWKAYDVQIEGISLVTNYRSSFAKEVRRSGMQGLIQRITELNDRRTKQVASNTST